MGGVDDMRVYCFRERDSGVLMVRFGRNVMPLSEYAAMLEPQRKFYITTVA